jgi:Ca2+-binding EF-hand superfamily protein
MPIVRPLRDPATVKCVKKYTTKNGERRVKLMVLFDYVRVPDPSLCPPSPQEEHGLTEDMLRGLQEIFQKFDTDRVNWTTARLVLHCAAQDGVITLDQVNHAVRATGRVVPAGAVVEMVRLFSSDKKNCSMEFNEFLKMMAAEERRDCRPQKEALVQAFRWVVALGGRNQ